MTWTMPRPVLHMVAWIIGLAAVSSFAAGIYTAPDRGRLPGERGPGQKGAAPIQAMEAVPLSQERIEGPPPPPELTPEEKAALEAEKKAKADGDAAARLSRLQAEKAAAPPAPAVEPTPLTPPPPAPAEKAPAQPEEPPF